jgi:hypothetical protein
MLSRLLLTLRKDSIMNLIRTLALTPVLAASLALAALPASASGLPNYSAGAIGANGAIAYGTGFTVTHKGVGQYIVTFPAGTGFTSLPAMTVTPWGISGHVVTAIVQSVAGMNGGATFLINLSDRVNKLHLADNAFMFTLMES